MDLANNNNQKNDCHYYNALFPFFLLYTICMTKKNNILHISVVLPICFMLLITIIVYWLFNKRIYIFGYGTLMSIKSVRKNMPNASNFRPGLLKNYIRIFSNQTSKGPILSIRKVKYNNQYVRGVIFDIPIYEYNNFVRREETYKIQKISVLDHDNNPRECHVCLEGNNTIYDNKYTEPSTNYLLFCLNILKNIDCTNYMFKNMKTKYIQNFLDNSYLSDGKTSIRKYLMNTSNVILEDMFYTIS